jgi:putative MFS transporter
LFALCRGFCNFALGGCIPITFALLAEFLPSKERGSYSTLLSGFWLVGSIIIAIIMLYVHNWQVIVGISTIPTVFFAVIAYHYMPESILFMMLQKDYDSSLNLITDILIYNSRNLYSFEVTLATPTESKGAVESRESERSPNVTVFQKLFSHNKWKTSVPLWLVWFFNSLGFGIYLWITKILTKYGFERDTIYSFMIIFSLFSLLSIVSAFFLIDTVGRPLLLKTSVLLAALLLACWSYMDEGKPILHFILLSSFNCFAQFSYCVLYIYTPELYATSVRATAFGLAAGLNRAGGVVAPIISAHIMEVSEKWTVFTYAIFYCIAFLCSLMLNVETKMKDLSDPCDETSSECSHE